MRIVAFFMLLTLWATLIKAEEPCDVKESLRVVTRAINVISKKMPSSCEQGEPGPKGEKGEPSYVAGPPGPKGENGSVKDLSNDVTKRLDDYEGLLQQLRDDFTEEVEAQQSKISRLEIELERQKNEFTNKSKLDQETVEAQQSKISKLEIELERQKTRNNIIEEKLQTAEDQIANLSQAIENQQKCEKPSPIDGVTFHPDLVKYSDGQKLTFSCSDTSTPSGTSQVICKKGRFPAIDFKCIENDFESCQSVYEYDANLADGVYRITPNPDFEFYAFCDITNGGWIIIQRRFDGSTNFHQNFRAYSDGFGDVKAEYWLGLEKIHQLTQNGQWQLRIEMEDYNQNMKYAHYSDFSIGEGPGFRLHIGGFSGTVAHDSLAYHNNQQFSTYDHDQDLYSVNCAEYRNGAWFWGSCGYSNLNSINYRNDQSLERKGMVWYDSHDDGWNTPLKKTTMKIKRS